MLQSTSIKLALYAKQHFLKLIVTIPNSGMPKEFNIEDQGQKSMAALVSTHSLLVVLDTNTTPQNTYTGRRTTTGINKEKTS
jgi:hypothetical protein